MGLVAAIAWVVASVSTCIVGIVLYEALTSLSARKDCKKCYKEASSTHMIYCSKVADNAFFPMESEDCADAYAMGKRYGG